MAQNIFHCPEYLVVTGTVTVGDAFVPAVDPIKSLVQLHGESEREAEPEGVRCHDQLVIWGSAGSFNLGP